MSYAICRIQKIGGAKDIAGIQIHNRRERNHSNSNPDINHSLSKLNFNFPSPEGTFNEIVDNIIKNNYQGKKAIRKDAVRMCEVIFTSDNAFFNTNPNNAVKYFEACYNWALNRFGKNNLVSATVHMDERTPHMHFDFVPMTSDGRLSAKTVIGDKKALQQLQDDFYEQVGKRFGLKRGERRDINGENDKRFHYDTPEFKNKTHYEKVEKTSAAIIKDINKCLKIQPNNIKFHKNNVSVTKEEYKNINNTLKNIKDFLKDYPDILEIIQSYNLNKKQVVKNRTEAHYFSSKELYKKPSKEAIDKANTKRKNEIFSKMLNVPEDISPEELTKILVERGLLKISEKDKNVER